MTLNNPQKLAALQLLYNGQGGGNYNFTLNFADGSSDSINNTPYVDWTQNPLPAADPRAYANTDLVAQANSTWNYWNSGVISLVENDFALSAADQQKVLDSVTFTPNGGGGLMIFALSGNEVSDNILSNNLVVNSDSTVDIRNSLASQMGNLTIGNNKLSITGDSGAVLTLGAATLTGSMATFDVQSATTLVLSGAVSGTSGIVKNNLGALQLSGTGSTYSGGTTLNAGVLQVNNPASLGAATSALLINGGTLEAMAGYTESHAIILNAPAIGIQVDAGTLVLNTALSGSGGLAMSGAGGLTLAQASSFSGDVAVSGGTLALGVAGALPAVNVAVNGGASAGGVLDLAGQSVTVNGLGGASGAVAGQIVNSATTSVTLTVGNNNATNITAAQINGNIALVKTGTGTQTLAGANGYTGGTTVSQGVLATTTNMALGTSAVTLNGGTLRLAAPAAYSGPESVSGFTGDDIAEASALSPGAATNVEYNGWWWYEQGAAELVAGLAQLDGHGRYAEQPVYAARRRPHLVPTPALRRDHQRCAHASQQRGRRG